MSEPRIIIAVVAGLLALAGWVATLGWQRAGRLEKELGIRARSLRALADLVRGR